MREIAFGDGGKHVDPYDPNPPARETNTPEPETEIDAGGTLAMVSLKLIDPSPYQPRTEFDSTELADLAASIQTHGLTQPPLTRMVGTRYELVAGERRFRAAKIAGLKEIPVLVRELSDAQAAELCLIENLQRKDLSAIDEARGYRDYLARTGATQQQLAERVGATQGHISNRIRLLELPEKIQARVISGKMTAAAARAIVPYCEHKPIAEAIVKRIGKPKRRWDKPPRTEEDVADFLEDVLQDFPDADRSEYLYECGGQVQLPKLTEAQRAELQIVTVPQPGGGKHTWELVLNEKAFDKLWKQTVADRKLRHQKKGDKKEQKAAKEAKTLTPAQVKARRAKADKQLADKIGRWKTDWLRRLCARAVVVSEPAQIRLLLFLARHDGHGESYTRQRQIFSDRCDVIDTVATKKAKDILGRLCAMGEPELGDAIAQVCEAMFYGLEDGPQEFVPPADVETLAKFLKIDLADLWTKQCSNQPQVQYEKDFAVLASYLDLHTRDQLVAQAKEWKIDLAENLPKSGMIGHLTAPGKRLKCPKALLKAKCQ